MNLIEQLEVLVANIYGHQYVTFILPQVGETSFETIEFKDAVEKIRELIDEQR